MLGMATSPMQHAHLCLDQVVEGHVMRNNQVLLDVQKVVTSTALELPEFLLQAFARNFKELSYGRSLGHLDGSPASTFLLAKTIARVALTAHPINDFCPPRRIQQAISVLLE